jgi:YgiT-type zinc finger domain-containing protein
MGKRIDITNKIEAQAIVCPQCGRSNILTSTQEQPFTYGKGPEAVQLSVQVPVKSCTDCGLEFLDQSAEELRHTAVCHYLGCMTPLEVASVRRLYKLNRSDFAKVTRIGEASLARWEASSLIQNAAYDQYLYLLTFEENLNRLLKRRPIERLGETKVETQAVSTTTRREVHGFRMITNLSDDQIIGRECFQLHPTQRVA